MKTRIIRKSADPRLSVTLGRENLTFFSNDKRVSGRNLYPYTLMVEGRAIAFAFKDYTGTLDELKVLADSAQKWSELLLAVSGGPDKVLTYVSQAAKK